MPEIYSILRRNRLTNRRNRLIVKLSQMDNCAVQIESITRINKYLNNAREEMRRKNQMSE